MLNLNYFNILISTSNIANNLYLKKIKKIECNYQVVVFFKPKVLRGIH